MILGKIIGKTSTQHFSFQLENKTQKFEYIQVMHDEYGYVLCQIIEIEREKIEIAKCAIIGYVKDGKLQQPRSPFIQGTEVLVAQNSFIKDVLNITQKNAAYIGKLENRDIKIYLDLNKLLSKHIAIIAKTGAGKSYTAGILIEEILQKKVPMLIIDPHGEYQDIALPSEQISDKEIEPKGYKDQVVEYGDPRIDESLMPLHLSEELNAQELLHILPAKLTQSQKALLYTLIKDINPLTLNTLIGILDQEQELAAQNLMSILDYIKSLQLFSADFTPYNTLIQPGKCSIINLKGIPPEVQQIIVYKLLTDLFEQRKLGNIAPFFAVIEEAHNFSPERSFGEAKSSGIIRTIASEGRKFGLGLCVVTQRPARLDKNVLSQCNTQIILKVTNPNDLKSLLSSIENLTAETADEIKNLPIGTALVTGVVDMPLMVKIRERHSKHGGSTVDILSESDSLLKDAIAFAKKEILPLILPKISKSEKKLMEGTEQIQAILIPALLLSVQKKTSKFKLLVELIKGHVVKNRDAKETIPLPSIRLSQSQKAIFDIILSLKEFDLVSLEKQSNLPILKLKDFLQTFEQMGLIEKNGENYKLGQSALLISDPKQYQFLDGLEYRQIEYKTKLKPKLTEAQIKEQLDFVEITEMKKCFIVYYKAE